MRGEGKKDKKEKKKDVRKTYLNIATFNVLGISKVVKQEQLSRDLKKYKVDICAIQESKIKEGTDTIVGKDNARLVTFKTALNWLMVMGLWYHRYLPIVYTNAGK